MIEQFDLCIEVLKWSLVVGVLIYCWLKLT